MFNDGLDNRKQTAYYQQLQSKSDNIEPLPEFNRYNYIFILKGHI